MTPLRPLRVLVGSALLLLSFARNAWALEPLDPEEFPPFFGEPTGSLWVGVHGALRHGDDGDALLGFVSLGVPLERVARPSARLAEGPKGAAPPAPSPPPSSAPEAPLPIPVVVRADVARAMLDAALLHARLPASTGRIDALATRARTAALLPELRVRVSQQLDEAQSQSPTEYDPSRTTSTGGTTLWLEGRATWRLDRLVFADEELALERMRAERAALARRIEEQVIEALIGWQRARALEADDGRTIEQHRDDVLAVLAHELTLDLLTGGAFSAHLREREAPLEGAR